MDAWHLPLLLPPVPAPSCSSEGEGELQSSLEQGGEGEGELQTSLGFGWERKEGAFSEHGLKAYGEMPPCTLRAATP